MTVVEFVAALLPSNSHGLGNAGRFEMMCKEPLK